MMCQIFIPCERPLSLVFREEKWLVGGDPFYLKFWVMDDLERRNSPYFAFFSPNSIALQADYVFHFRP